MDDTDLVRSDRVRLGWPPATSSVPRARPRARPRGAHTWRRGLYSTSADMARYVACLLQEGVGPGSYQAINRREMFPPQFQPDPRVPGTGLGFNLGAEGEHRTVGKDGVVAGFLADMTMAPQDGIGVVVLTNTGGLSAQGAAVPLGTALLRHLLELPDEALRTDLAPRAEVWADLCGWYAPAPGPVTNLFARALMGAGAEVVVHRNQLMLKALTPSRRCAKACGCTPTTPRIRTSSASICPRSAWAPCGSCSPARRTPGPEDGSSCST